MEVLVRGISNNGRKAERDTMLLALKMEEGTTSQGIWVASRSWKGKEVDYSLEPPEGKSYGHIDFIPMRNWDTSILQNCKMLNIC